LAAARDTAPPPRAAAYFMPAFAGYDGVSIAHGTAKDAKFACLIVIGLRLNPV
jgi:hypothetical protein